MCISKLHNVVMVTLYKKKMNALYHFVLTGQYIEHALTDFKQSVSLFYCVL